MNSENASEKTFAGRTIIAVGIVVSVFLLIALLYFTFDVVLLVFAAVLLSIFLRGLADLLGRFLKIGEGWLVVIVSVILIAVLGGAVALLSPSVAEQVQNLRRELPLSAAAAAAYVSQFRWGQALLDQLPTFSDVMANVNSASMVSRVGGIFSSTVGAIGNFLLVILLAIYFASEPEFYVNGFIKLFPIASRRRVSEVLVGMGETLRWWLIGKAGSMIFIGLLSWIGLSLLGVPLALTLGLIAGLLSFIPNFGPILSAVPALLLAFIESPRMAIYVLGLYIGVQVIESNLVTPLIERETVELPPALTIVFQLGLTVLVGGLGLVLATPLLAGIMVIVQMIYIQDILGDRETEVNKKDLDEKVDGTDESADDKPIGVRERAPQPLGERP